jgi:hypothetical protein
MALIAIVTEELKSAVQDTLSAWEERHPILPQPRKLFVSMLNDFPFGVYSTNDLAEKAEIADWLKREPTAYAQRPVLKRGQSRDVVGGTSFVFTKYFYRHYEFEVDAEARL